MDEREQHVLKAEIYLSLAEDLAKVKAAGPTGYWFERLSLRLSKQAQQHLKAAKGE